jgi:release factor H-coupled RctB family protein
MKPALTVFSAPGTWIESAAIDQLTTVASLPGMRRAVGLPDLHPGKGAPIGAAFAVQGLLYPHLVGNDIGCGMGLWTTDQLAHRFKLDRLASRVNLDGEYDGDIQAELAAEGVDAGAFAGSLGTIGGGNHFAELQRFSSVVNPDRIAQLGIDTKCLAILIHSGSRGLGESILRAHIDRHHGPGPLSARDDEGQAYRDAHDRAVRWARANRRVIARRMLEAARCSGRRALDVCHNSVTACALEGADVWLHRKGAAPADQGPLVIPGSRGDLSNLVEPEGDGRLNLWSLAHGAGRKWQRSEAKGKLGAKADRALLQRTSLGSRVICEDKDLLFEEAPEAYKAIDQVIGPLADAGLLRVLAVLTPVLTYKTRRR